MKRNSVLHRFYRANKDNFIIKNTYNFLQKIIFLNRKKKAIMHFKSQSSLHREAKVINVVFIVQYIPAWNKSQDIYEIMKNDNNFDPYILCVPNDLECAYQNNDVYQWFINNGYDCINAKLPNNSWFDLRSLNPEYVFHSRPYNTFMPYYYKSFVINKYAKLCHILYGFDLTEADLEATINNDYFVDSYCYYASSIDERNYYLAKIRHSKYQQSKYLGYPGLTNVYEERFSKEKGIWGNTNKNTSDYKIMWTPRWSTDKKIGGSNFLRYKSLILDYADKNQDICLAIRPHPLAFTNFVKTGEMTENEVVKFKTYCDISKNIILDESKEYVHSLWNIDILISDYSGIIFEYFVTGKPLIFCPEYKTDNVKLLPEFQKILSVSYIANNFEEVKKIITQIRDGYDPKLADRKKLIDEMFGYRLEISPQLICDDLKNDKANVFD